MSGDDSRVASWHSWARVLGATVTLAACSGSGDAEPASLLPHSQSGSIVLSPEGNSLWLTSPDDDSVVEIATDDLRVLRSISIAGAPEQLAWGGGRLLVSLGLASDLALIEPDSGAVSLVGLPCGGTRAVVAAGDRAWVSCPNDDLVLELDVPDQRVTRVIESPGSPTALALEGSRLAVSASRTGGFRVLSIADGTVLEEIRLSPGAGISAVQVDALASSGAGFLAAYQRVDHDSDRTRPADDGGYGSVVDGDPRIAPQLLSPCGKDYAIFDGGARVFSGPSAVAQAGGVLWVANLYTDNISVLDCAATGKARAGLAGFRGTVRVGRAPRGIAVSPDGKRAFVDVGFDHSVAKIELDDVGSGVNDPTLEIRREVGASRFSEAGARGRSIFHDAVDTHLTPSGIVTCATCHPGGGDDGINWFLHTREVGPKLRRTPPAWGARPEMSPFHWDGEFDDGAVLTKGTILALMEGDGLLVDTQSVAAYMAEIPLPPGLPVAADDQAAVERGKALFESDAVGCSSCHLGSFFTDGEQRTVVAPSEDLDARVRPVDTPSLRGVRVRSPFLHDGRAATLREVVTSHNPSDTHGVTSGLTGEELDDLLLYLRTL